MELEDYQQAMAVHFWGPLYLIQEVIPHMKARRQGRIVNIASIGGKVAVPHLLPYAASKFALVGLSEGLRAELLKDGIYVTTVCPGLMRTGSHLNAYFKGQHEKEYALFAITNASPLFSTTSEAAARKIIEACRYGKAEIVITPQAGLLRLAHDLLPGLMADTFGLLNRLLPQSESGAGDRLQRGAQSRSRMAPSWLTRPADRAAARNNEL
jgi:short-subunit dehydrogenase